MFIFVLGYDSQNKLSYENSSYNPQSWTKIVKNFAIVKNCTHGVPLRQIWYSYDLSPCPTLVIVVQSGAEIIQLDVVFWGKGQEGSICN